MALLSLPCSCHVMSCPVVLRRRPALRALCFVTFDTCPWRSARHVSSVPSPQADRGLWRWRGGCEGVFGS